MNEFEPINYDIWHGMITPIYNTIRAGYDINDDPWVGMYFVMMNTINNKIDSLIMVIELDLYE